MGAENVSYVSFVEDGAITVGSLVNTKMLDGTTVVDFGAQAMGYVSGRAGLKLLLDFSNIDYLASAALTELIKINDEVISNGGTFRICGLSPSIEKVFEITNFMKTFEITAGEDLAHAKARFNRSIEISKEEEAWDKRHDR